MALPEFASCSMRVRRTLTRANSAPTKNPFSRTRPSNPRSRKMLATAESPMLRFPSLQRHAGVLICNVRASVAIPLLACTWRGAFGVASRCVGAFVSSCVCKTTNTRTYERTNAPTHSLLPRPGRERLRRERIYVVVGPVALVHRGPHAVAAGLEAAGDVALVEAEDGAVAQDDFAVDHDIGNVVGLGGVDDVLHRVAQRGHPEALG